MQAEATDSSLREGVEALAVKDTEKTAEDNTEHRETEMTDATEEDSATKHEKSSSKTHTERQISLVTMKEKCLSESSHDSVCFSQHRFCLTAFLHICYFFIRWGRD